MASDTDAASGAKDVMRLLQLHHKQRAELDVARAAITASYAKRVEALVHRADATNEAQSATSNRRSEWPALERAAAIGRSLPEKLQHMLLKRLPEPIREEYLTELFSFDIIPTLPARSIQDLLRFVEKRTLAIALLGAADEVFHAVTQNMSARAASMLKEDMESLLATGELKTRDVQEARHAVSSVIRTRTLSRQEEQ